jgi:O-antigen/teichoic acid export membrane protein
MATTNLNNPLQTVTLRSAALVGSKTVQDGLLSLLLIWLARNNQMDYGLIVLGSSVAMLLRALQSMGLDQYTLREFSSSQANTGSLLWKMIKIKTLIAGGTFFIFLAFAFFFTKWPFHQTAIILILLLGQAFEGLADTFFNLFRAEGQSINESLCRTGPNLIASVYGAGCLYFQVDIIFFSLLFLLSGTLKLSTAIFGATRLCNRPLQSTTPFSFDKGKITSLALVAIISFFGTFYNEIQIFWIKQYHSFIDVSIYKVAYDVTTFACGAVAQLIVGAILFPLLINAFTHKDKTKFQNIVRSYFKQIITIGSGVAAFLCIFGGKFVLFVYGDQYLEAEALVPLFGIAAFFSFVNNFSIYVLLSMRQEKRLVLYLLAPITISILSGPLLIASVGPTGAVISLLLCRATLSMILITTLQRKIHLLKVVEYKNVALYWFVAATLFILLAPVNYLLSSCLALSFYFVSIWYEQKKHTNKD